MTAVFCLILFGIIIGIAIGIILGMLLEVNLTNFEKKRRHKKYNRDLYDDLEEFTASHGLSGNKNIMDRSRRDQSAKEFH